MSRNQAFGRRAATRAAMRRNSSGRLRGSSAARKPTSSASGGTPRALTGARSTGSACSAAMSRPEGSTSMRRSSDSRHQSGAPSNQGATAPFDTAKSRSGRPSSQRLRPEGTSLACMRSRCTSLTPARRQAAQHTARRSYLMRLSSSTSTRSRRSQAARRGTAAAALQGRPSPSSQGRRSTVRPRARAASSRGPGSRVSSRTWTAAGSSALKASSIESPAPKRWEICETQASLIGKAGTGGL
jgi:hypothetical protein